MSVNILQLGRRLGSWTKEVIFLPKGPSKSTYGRMGIYMSCLSQFSKILGEKRKAWSSRNDDVGESGAGKQRSMAVVMQLSGARIIQRLH